MVYPGILRRWFDVVDLCWVDRIDYKCTYKDPNEREKYQFVASVDFCLISYFLDRSSNLRFREFFKIDPIAMLRSCIDSFPVITFKLWTI